MKKIVLFCVVAASFAAAMTGCTTLYHPQLADVPMIDHKGDIRVSLNGEVTTPYSVGSTVTVGVTDAFAIQLHANTNIEVDKNFYSHLAAGLFKSMGSTLLEGYAALGFGIGENWNGADILYTTKGHYVLPFLQLNYGLHNATKAHIDAGVALKVGVMVPEFTIHYYNNGSQPESFAEYATANMLLEPQFFFRIGDDKVRFTFQFGYNYLNDMHGFEDSHYLDWSWRPNPVRYDSFSASLGLTFYL